MRREPAVVYLHRDGRETTVIHGTARAAMRNAAILGPDRARFEWVEVPTLLDRVRAWVRR